MTWLQHILDETEYLLVASSSLNREQFLKDNTLRRAFVRSIEIIGEAAKGVPNSFREKYMAIDCRNA